MKSITSINAELVRIVVTKSNMQFYVDVSCLLLFLSRMKRKLNKNLSPLPFQCESSWW